MTTHTPGPWRVDETELDGRRRGYIREVSSTAGGNHLAVARVTEVMRSHDEWRANARLIAAAPDLLAALAPLATWAEHERREHRAHGEDNEAEYMGKLADAARAAIARATGNGEG